MRRNAAVRKHTLDVEAVKCARASSERIKNADGAQHARPLRENLWLLGEKYD